MMPVYKSMAGKGKLMSKNIEIGNSNTFIKIADALKNDKFRKLSLTDLNISFEIKNGRVYVSPFETKFGNSKMTIGGDQGLDQTLNYIINMAIPRAEFGGAANTVLNNLTAKAASNGLNIQPGENVNVGVLVSGTFLKPEIKLNLKDNAKNAAQDIKDQMKNQAAQKVQEVKEDVTAKAKVQADKLVKDAEAEAQKIRDGAKSAADQLRKESNDAADKVVSEAKNPLLKVAAQKTAEKMRKEGEAKAKKLEDEGNLKADALVNKAKEEAGKIK
jgi:vacuolar-type H+-ATPase subunit H